MKEKDMTLKELMKIDEISRNLSKYDPKKEEEKAMAYIAEAGHDEHGRYIGGAAGDQTGTECYVHSYYNYPWDHFLEPIGDEFANDLANQMVDAANNDHIGYDQNQRNSAYAKFKKYHSIASICEDCEVDCSALVSLCVTAAGCDILSMRSNAPVTSTLRSVLLGTGKFKEVKKPTKRGTICLSTGNHTAVYLGSEKGRVTLKKEEKKTETKAETKKTVSQIAAEVIDGKWGNGDDRKDRLKKAGYNPAEVQAKVNQLLGVSTSSTQYYKAFNNVSIVDGLNSIGVNSSFSNRKKIAKANGISTYLGTASQNTKLCGLARQGKLKKA